MRISIVRGHLTQTEKRHIKALFNNNLTEGKINRKKYFITFDENEECYKIGIIENKWSDSAGKIIPKMNTAAFTVK